MSNATESHCNVVLLAGGVGGAKMAEGFAFSKYGKNLSIIGNVADDQEFHGLWVSPDIDTLTYTLANLIDREKGWGIKEETNRVLDTLSRLGSDTWMYLGDQDFATHIYRTEQRRKGIRPTEIAQHIAKRLGIEPKILLPTDDCIQTRLLTDKGWLDFQSYFVRERCEPEIKELKIEGADMAAPTPEAVSAIRGADLIVFAPSNPVVSIGAILSVPGIREEIERAPAYKVAVSPLINGKTVKGPADKMLLAAGYRNDVLGVAEIYQGIIDALVIDHEDQKLSDEVGNLGLDVMVAETFMSSLASKTELAESVVDFFKSTRHARTSYETLFTGVR